MNKRSKRKRRKQGQLTQAGVEQQRQLTHLLQMEKLIYPETLRLVGQVVATWRDLVWFCEGSPGLLTWDTGYLLCAQDQIADWAKLPDTAFSRAQFFECLRFMAMYYGDRSDVQACCRDSTSYPLFLNLERRSYIRILSNHPTQMSGEGFHDLTLQFLPKSHKAA